jgi:hypothetical protein
MVGAKRLGVGAELDAREQNIANMIKQAGGQSSGMVKAGGKEMSLADYKKQYNVSDKEYQAVMRKTELNSVAATTKASQPAAAPATGTPGAPTTTTTTPAAGTPAAPKTAVAPTVVPATPAVPPATEATNLLTQQQADTRGIIMAGKMDLTNSILTQVSTALATKAASGNEKLHDKLVDINGNTQRVIARADKIAIATATSATKLTNMDTAVQQLLIVNKNLQALLDAQVTGKEGNVILKLDGKTVARNIIRREDNASGDPTMSGLGSIKP